MPQAEAADQITAFKVARAVLLGRPARTARVLVAVQVAMAVPRRAVTAMWASIASMAAAMAAVVAAAVGRMVDLQ
ncbi:hypothetical protein [Mesorhizobium xinjiangense]|uniref:hypothetical protein n=1 Tax=Mesorhizobium xinjiangense TaxID=2678685 RepID=UPI001AEDD6C9|nr:hypothetical protein [Mesorhizobium xinjiangense]